MRKYFDKDVDRSKGGQPGYNYILMFKILILLRYYNLSDDSIEYAILDRLSFMRFLGLGINVTTAKIHGNEAIEGLLKKTEVGGQPLHADSAYRNEAIEKM